MQLFNELFQNLDSTTSTLRKTAALAEYFKAAPPKDAVWALYLLVGRKQKRLLNRSVLQTAIQSLAQLPSWLFEESYAVVGDLAETIALLLPASERFARTQPAPLHIWMEQFIPELSRSEDPVALLQSWWLAHDKEEVFLINKLITGGFRTGVAKNIVIKALAEAFAVSEAHIAERLIGEWPVSAEWFLSLGEVRSDGDAAAPRATPYPFYLASALDSSLIADSSIEDFALEWKWDGIRAQLVKRGAEIGLWSRGEELLNESFPEVIAAAKDWNRDLILDGELLLEREGSILPFAELQKRISRKNLSAKWLASHPALFLAFDCLEEGGQDLREKTQRERRERLDALLSDAPALFRASPLLKVQSWEEAESLRAEAFQRSAEGLMLKHWQGPYRIGRRRGEWWKWKVDPLTLDAVLIYAQAGHGRRANLLTDYTFALWKEEQLVPFAKAYSGLTDVEILELDRWIKGHTRERFGPVRSVEPLRVFEIAFEGIALSKRHKAGIAVRFPRILRERLDKTPAEADTVERAQELIHEQSH